jgi:hypothetical protein
MDNQIQFISAEELRKLSELERANEVARTAEGMLSDMEQVYNNLGGAQFMQEWAQNHPGDFFKLKAKVMQGIKNPNNTQRIYIGLPTTELDS